MEYEMMQGEDELKESWKYLKDNGDVSELEDDLENEFENVAEEIYEELEEDSACDLKNDF